MQIALTHNHFDADHFIAVKAEMATLGAPTIKAVRLDGDLYAALEGCHRLRAAFELGLTPEIEEIEYSDGLVSSLGLGMQDDVTIADICDAVARKKVLVF